MGMRKHGVGLVAVTALVAWSGVLAAPAMASGDAPASAGGATIEVPADYATIQEAVDSAAPGDLILVSPGTYHEAVDVTDRRTSRSAASTATRSCSTASSSSTTASGCSAPAGSRSRT